MKYPKNAKCLITCKVTDKAKKVLKLFFEIGIPPIPKTLFFYKVYSTFIGYQLPIL